MSASHLLRPLLACSLAFVAACGGSPHRRGDPLPAAAPELTVEGLGDPMLLRQAELEALGPEDIPWTQQGGNDLYRGVTVEKVLARAGLESGDGGPGISSNNKNVGWRRIVIAECTDGYTAVFSSAELMSNIGGTRAFVAWRKNGTVLPVDEAPIRLLVATDKGGARSVRQLKRLFVDLPHSAAEQR